MGYPSDKLVVSVSLCLNIIGQYYPIYQHSCLDPGTQYIRSLGAIKILEFIGLRCVSKQTQYYYKINICVEPPCYSDENCNWCKGYLL